MSCEPRSQSVPADSGVARESGIVVLANVVELPSNDYVAMWNEIIVATGATLRLLSWKSLRNARPGRGTVIHLQWPEMSTRGRSPSSTLLKSLQLLGLVLVARARHNRVLVTVHNLSAHDGGRRARLLWSMLCHLATDVHLLDRAAAQEVFAAYPALATRDLHVVAHMNYRSRVPDVAPRNATAGPTQLLFFGALRRYKGIERLIDVFDSLPTGQFELTIVGRPQDRQLAESLALSAGGRPGITLRLGHASDDDLAAAIARCDLVVLPYTQVLNSGSLLLALSLRRPVLVPSTPTFEAIAGRTGQGWVSTFAELDSRDIIAASGAPRTDLDLAWSDPTCLTVQVQHMLAS